MARRAVEGSQVTYRERQKQAAGRGYVARRVVEGRRAGWWRAGDAQGSGRGPQVVDGVCRRWTGYAGGGRGGPQAIEKGVRKLLLAEGVCWQCHWQRVGQRRGSAGGGGGGTKGVRKAVECGCRW